MLPLLNIQKVASAVEAGRLAAIAGRTDNPFTGDEDLRKAFHYGWNIGSTSNTGMRGERYFTEQELLDQKV